MDCARVAKGGRIQVSATASALALKGFHLLRHMAALSGAAGSNRGRTFSDFIMLRSLRQPTVSPAGLRSDERPCPCRCGTVQRSSADRDRSGWKSFTAHHIKSLSGRIGSIWQDESFDRIIRDERELVEKLAYIQGNPQKRWPEIRDYPWLWISKQI